MLFADALGVFASSQRRSNLLLHPLPKDARSIRHELTKRTFRSTRLLLASTEAFRIFPQGHSGDKATCFPILAGSLVLAKQKKGTKGRYEALPFIAQWINSQPSHTLSDGSNRLADNSGIAFAPQSPTPSSSGSEPGAHDETKRRRQSGSAIPRDPKFGSGASPPRLTVDHEGVVVVSNWSRIGSRNIVPAFARLFSLRSLKHLSGAFRS